MRRELVLATGVVAVLSATVLVVGLVPGALAEPRDDAPPSRLDLRDTKLSASDVSGETVTLSVDTFLAHRGGPATNVTVAYRAVDADTGLVADTRTAEVGSVADEREVTARGNLTVEREGGYRIETVVYEDGRRRLTGTTEVRGVDTLTPAYAESTVRFHRFDADLPSVQYHVEDVDDNRTTLTVSTYLTNGGDDAAGDLRLVVQARQADSNIVADEAEVDVGAIRPGRTETPTAELTVPTGYDYYLDAVLWKDGVIVGTARSAANLDPTETIDVNATRREVGLRVGEFEPDEEPDEDAPAPERTPTPSASSGPGFGVVAAVIALLGALAARRWSA